MGLVVELQDEVGTRQARAIEDSHNLLHHLLPSHEDQSYRCLRYIDCYGDTIFNHLQMPDFITEIDRIRVTTSSPEEQVLLDQIQHLAERCRRGNHLYLKFIGD